MEEFFFEKPFLDDFYLYNLGYQECGPTHTYGPSSRENYILHFITKGRGTFVIEDTKYELKEGDFFLVRPSAVIYYEANKQDPWAYNWIGFNGIKTDMVLEYLKLDCKKHVGRVINYKDISEKFNDIFNKNILENTNKITVQQYLFDILGAFKSEDTSVDHEKEKDQRYSYSFITYIKHYYRKPDLKISEIASSFGLNNSYFSQVIKREMGMTPNEYLTYYRMAESGTMLMKSDKSVKEIAYLVGYENSLTFSRAFKKTHGVSPIAYREQHGSFPYNN